MRISFPALRLTWITYMLSGLLIFITFISIRNIEFISWIPVNREFYMILGLSLLIAFSVPSLIEYLNYRESQLIDREVVTVLMEITDGIKSGLTLQEALERSSKAVNTPLRQALKQIVAKIYLGVNPYEALDIVYGKLKTQLSKRFVRILKQSLISGGNITDSLSIAADLYKEINLFEYEKKTEIRPFISVIYLSFIIYLFIAYVTVAQFIKAISGFTKVTMFSLGVINPMFYNALFFYVGLIQAIFGGIMAGKLSTGSIKTGFIHTVIMIIILLVSYYLFFK